MSTTKGSAPEGSLYTYTIVCFGAEIGFGEGETFEWAKEEAEEQANIQSLCYPREEWGYIAVHPSGMRVEFQIGV